MSRKIRKTMIRLAEHFAKRLPTADRRIQIIQAAILSFIPEESPVNLRHGRPYKNDNKENNGERG
jgi:hypothetical protein